MPVRPVPTNASNDPTWRDVHKPVEIRDRDSNWQDGHLYAWRRLRTADPAGWYGWCEWETGGRVVAGWKHQGDVRER